MSFLPNRYKREIGSRAAAAAMSVGGSRVQKSAFAQTVLAPVLLNHIPFYITPYMGLRARLSQVWINRWTILLLLVLVRTLLAIVSIHGDIDSARREALAACTGVEAIGSAMASMPHYLSAGVNELTADGVEKAIDGLMSMLTLSVTGVEEIVVFVINMMTQTYLCLITLVITGSLHAAIALIEDATSFLNKTLPGIGDDIQSAVTDFQKTLNDAISGLNDVSSDFGGSSTLPTLNLDTQISALKNLQLPSGLDSDLNTLNASIPTFAQVNNFTQTAIRFPFEEIKSLIANHTGNYTFDRNGFPVPAKQALTFCSGNNGINAFFDDLINLIYEARKISIAVLVVLALLVMLPMAYLEIRRNRTMATKAELFKDDRNDPLDAVYQTTHPMTATAGLKVAQVLPFKATRRQALIRWAIAYATTIPALFVLSLGVAGLFSCLSRYLILITITKEVPELAQEIEHFADDVVASLNNASAYWASGTNNQVLSMSNRINNDVFGWVNISTHALNETLNTFVDQTIDVLNATFGGTILYDPVTELFNCLIGLKIAGIERGLTWISDNAHVSFPELQNNTFSLGAAASVANDSSAASFLSSPNTGSTDAISAAVDALVAHFENSILTEAYISAGVVGIWVIIALIGLGRALYLFWGNGDVRDGGDRTAESSPSFVCKGDFRDEKEFPSEVLDPSEREPTFPDVTEKGNNPFADPHPHRRPVPPRQPQQPYTLPIPMPPPAVRLQPPSSTSSPTTSATATTAPANASSAGAPNDGNTYNSVPYTIDPRPFPRFADPVTPGSPPDQRSFLSPPTKQQQRQDVRPAVKFAGERNIGWALKRPGQARQSSHGQVGVANGGGAKGGAVNGGANAAQGPGQGYGGGAQGNVTFEGLGH